MPSRPKPAAKCYRRREDADERFQSVLTAVKAIHALPDDLVLRIHKRRLLSNCLWQLTLADAKGKHNLRFASKSACESLEAGKTKGLRHEHVYPRKAMVDELLAAELMQIEDVLRKARCCAVTKSEHDALCGFDDEAEGWERYRRADIAVYDRANGTLVPFDELLDRK